MSNPGCCMYRPDLYRTAPLCDRISTVRAMVRFGLSSDIASAHRSMVEQYREMRPFQRDYFNVYWRKDWRRKKWVKAHMEPGPCVYCGKPDPEGVDHVIPTSQAGPSYAWNLVWACRKCNAAKGCRTPEQWRAGIRSDLIKGVSQEDAVFVIRRMVQERKLAA